MNKQDKKLLFKDLSARIPYKTMLWIEDAVSVNNDRLLAVGLNHGDCLYINGLCVDDNCYDRHNIIKPYLRSLSDMTEEEKKEYNDLMLNTQVSEAYFPHFEDMYLVVDWLNEHHFDFRGLINKGLALKAPKGMYD